MTPPARPPNPGADPPTDGGAVAELAREVDALRRAVDPLVGLPGRVDETARLVSQLTDALAAVTARKGPTPAPSWLMAPTDPDQVAALLGELCAWLGAVYLRYPDAASGMPECWLWHPDVVEELLWLMHAWCAAYQGSGASVSAAGDWHDRQRPGVVARIRKSSGSCSPEAHQTRPGWPAPASGAVEVLGVDAVPSIARWWATGRDHPAPEPASGSSRYASNGGRRR